jgi:hypothetical protein
MKYDWIDTVFWCGDNTSYPEDLENNNEMTTMACSIIALTKAK